MDIHMIAKKIDTHLKKSQWSQAIAICQKTLEQAPNNVQLHCWLGQAYTGLGEYEQALSIYRKACQLQPSSAGVYGELGQLYHQMQQWSQAIACYQKALSINPDWAELHYNLSLIFYELGDWQGALDQVQEAIRLKPDGVNSRCNLAFLYSRMGKRADAIEVYRQVIAAHPDRISVYNNLADLLFQSKDYTESIEICRQGIKVSPDPKLLGNLGQAYLATNNLGEAIQCFEQAIELDRTSSFAHHNLGRIWYRFDDYRKAKQFFAKTVELLPNNAEALNDFGTVSFDLGEWEEAFSAFRSGIALQPEFVDYYCRQDLREPSQNERERSQSVCRDFLKSLVEENKTAAILNRLAEVYRNQAEISFSYGALARAETFFQKAIRIQPQRKELYSQLGNCLEKQGRSDAAVAIYSMAKLLRSQEWQQSSPLSLLSKKSAANLTKNRQQTFRVNSKITKSPLKGIYANTENWVIASQSAEVELFPVSLQFSNPELHEPVIPQPSSSTAKVDDCGGVTCRSCMSRLIDAFQPSQLGPQVYKCNPPAFELFSTFPRFVVVIPRGKAWIAPQKNDWLICKEIAITTEDGYLLGDISRFYPWYLPGCTRHDLGQHPIFEMSKLPAAQDLDGTVAVLSGLSGHIYYHWMMDVLPRIGLLSQADFDIDSIDWFVINSLDKPFQKETLKALGIPQEKLIQSDIIPHIQADKLVVPSFPGELDWVPKHTIEFLRHHFLETSTLQADKHIYPKKIYISRAHAQYRRLVNEEQVVELLRGYGFQAVYLEQLTVAEQAKMFSVAEAIVAPHGAGLTNLVFCQAAAKVIEIFSPDYLRTDYWMVSQQLSLEHYYVVGRPFEVRFIASLMYESPLTEDILVDLDSLRAAIYAGNMQ